MEKLLDRPPVHEETVSGERVPYNWVVTWEELKFLQTKAKASTDSKSPADVMRGLVEERVATTDTPDFEERKKLLEKTTKTIEKLKANAGSRIYRGTHLEFELPKSTYEALTRDAEDMRMQLDEELDVGYVRNLYLIEIIGRKMDKETFVKKLNTKQGQAS